MYACNSPLTSLPYHSFSVESYNGTYLQFLSLSGHPIKNLDHLFHGDRFYPHLCRICVLSACTKLGGSLHFKFSGRSAGHIFVLFGHSFPLQYPFCMSVLMSAFAQGFIELAHPGRITAGVSELVWRGTQMP